MQSSILTAVTIIGQSDSIVYGRVIKIYVHAVINGLIHEPRQKKLCLYIQIYHNMYILTSTRSGIKINTRKNDHVLYSSTVM